MNSSKPAGEPARTILARILRSQRLTGREVCDLKLSASGNTIVVETAALIIRIAWCAPIHARAESRIWRAAGRAGLPVPELAAHGEVEGHEFVVYPRLPGRPSPTGVGVLREAGVKLAALHSATVDAFPVELDSRPRRVRRFALARTFVRDQVRNLPRGVPECVRRAEADWKSAFHTPTHGDFRGPNILTRGGRLSGVLDWSDARRASREADLGSVDWARFCGVLDGYLTVAPDVRGTELVGYFAGRYGALAAGGVVTRGAALEAVERCVAAVELRGITFE